MWVVSQSRRCSPFYSHGCRYVTRKPNGYWSNPAQQREFLDHVAKRENITSVDDWAQRNVVNIVKKYGGSALLKKYPNTSELLRNVYPELQWPLVPSQIPRNYWKSRENNQKFWEHVQRQTNTPQIEDIPKKVTRKEITELGGGGLLSKHKSIIKALEYAFPDNEWSVHHQKQKPNNYWDSLQNQRTFMEELRKKMNLKDIKDLLLIGTNTLRDCGGRALLDKYESYGAALQSIYPEYPWEDVHTNIIPRNYWKDIKNQRDYFERLRKELNLKELDEWRKVKLSDHQTLKYIVGSNYSSFFEALKAIYPEHDWKVASPGTRVPYNYWKNIENQREFMEMVRQKFGFSVEEWVDQPVQIIRDSGGPGLLTRYTNFFELLRSVYPEVKWEEKDRKQYPRGYWESKEHIHSFLTALKSEYQITREEDWYRISTEQIKQAGGGGILARYGSLGKLLLIGYPEVKWNLKRFSLRDKRSEQRWLLLQLRKLFHDEELIEDFVHEDMTRESGSRVEIDIYIPKYNVGFEYHGKHHYSEITAFGPLEMYQKRDIEKKELCMRYGVEIIVVPYWWDGTIDSLLPLCKDTRIAFLSNKESVSYPFQN